MNEDTFALQQFKGIARLLPLPNVVLFPHVIQPLHIFEPRYRQMTTDALSSDRLIAPVLLRPGWEEDYGGRPAVCPILSLGRIVAEQKLPDGRFNLFLRGLSRARIVEELPQDRLYRCARIELLADCNSPPDKAARKLRRQIGQSVHGWFPPEGQTREQLEQLLKNPDLPLGILCDLLGFALGLTIEVKQALLEELDIDRRARQLLEHLQTSQPPEPIAAPTAVSRKFPPDFSQN